MYVQYNTTVEYEFTNRDESGPRCSTLVTHLAVNTLRDCSVYREYLVYNNCSVVLTSGLLDPGSDPRTLLFLYLW